MNPVENKIETNISEYQNDLDLFMSEGYSWAEASRMALNNEEIDPEDIPF